MSITDQITRIQNAKSAIKTSIENKGVTVAADAKLDAFPALIDSIEVGSGGGSPTEYINPDFYNIRTANGTDYRYLFYEFNNQLKNKAVYEAGLNLSNWDVSKVIYYMYMFNYAYVKKIDVSGWAQMVNRKEQWNFMDAIFSYFNGEEIDITGWNTRSIERCSWFFGCSNLKKIYGELDLSNLRPGWLTKSSIISTSPDYMFKYNYNLEYVKLNNIYANKEMDNSSSWSIQCFEDSKLSDECLVHIFNNLPDLYNKGLTETDQIVFVLPKTNTLTADQVTIATNKGWTVTNTTY